MKISSFQATMGYIELFVLLVTTMLIYSNNWVPFPLNSTCKVYLSNPFICIDRSFFEFFFAALFGSCNLQFRLQSGCIEGQQCFVFKRFTWLSHKEDCLCLGHLFSFIFLIIIIIIYIYIYIYITETFETPTIFHISTILKNK